MQPTANPIKTILIVGGGTAGWMAAAFLSSIFKRKIQITLVESTEIGTIGVGEATIPPFLTFLNSIGIDEKDFIQSTQATYKLGIRFDSWLEAGHSYFHPFGQIGRDIDGLPFYQCWLKNVAEGHTSQLMDHSPAAQMAAHSKFVIPGKFSGSPIASASYALHIDAHLAAQYLRRIAQANGVKHIDGKLVDVSTSSDGAIRSVELADGSQFSSDLFIDCSGFRGLLIEEALHTGYDDWRNYLPCDRAVTIQTENRGDTPPFTVAAAQAAGWTWHIPLQHRTGNGYVYSSRHCSDEEALATLLGSIHSRPLTEPRVIPFVTGKRKELWRNNCLALGLAGGFIEPLESTAIHLVFKTLAQFVRLFPDKDFDQALQNQFNTNMTREYEEIRDFIILHYCTTNREDSAFWRHCKSMPIPETLQRKLSYFKLRGELIKGEEDLFRPPSWYAVLDGMEVKPKKYNPTADALDASRLAQSINQGSKAIQQFVAQLPSHDEFLRHVCPAHPV